MPANLFEHVLALAFFIGIGILLWGLLIRKEYRQYKFQFWDVLLVLAIALFAVDNLNTLVTPHPLFHEGFFI